MKTGVAWASGVMASLTRSYSAILPSLRATSPTMMAAEGWEAATAVAGRAEAERRVELMQDYLKELGKEIL